MSKTKLSRVQSISKRASGRASAVQQSRRLSGGGEGDGGREWRQLLLRQRWGGGDGCCRPTSTKPLYLKRSSSRVSHTTKRLSSDCAMSCDQKARSRLVSETSPGLERYHRPFTSALHYLQGLVRDIPFSAAATEAAAVSERGNQIAWAATQLLVAKCDCPPIACFSIAGCRIRARCRALSRWACTAPAPARGLGHRTLP